jgi:hypothetical protein
MITIVGHINTEIPYTGPAAAFSSLPQSGSVIIVRTGGLDYDHVRRDANARLHQITIW